MNPKNIMNPHPEDDAQQVGETNEFKGEATLPSVQSKTGEEDDQEVIKYRAKMYRFLQMKNRRGGGDVKFLKNNQTQKIRLLVRQDKIQLAIQEGLCQLNQLKTAEKSCIWACFDTSDEQTKICNLASEFLVLKEFERFKTEFGKSQENHKVKQNWKKYE